MDAYEQIKKLVSNYILCEEKKEIIKDLIAYYILPFNIEELKNIYDKIVCIKNKTIIHNNSFKVFLSNTLTMCKDLHVAILYCIKKGFKSLKSLRYLHISKNEKYSNRTICSIYCQLLDYHCFEISNLPLNDYCKIIITKYKHKKYNGINVKCARSTIL